VFSVILPIHPPLVNFQGRAAGRREGAEEMGEK
jgi:hypothetical protein